MNEDPEIQDALTKHEDRAWSDSAIDYSMLTTETVDYEDVSQMSMYEYMDTNKWHELEQTKRRVALDEQIFNLMYLNLHKHFKSSTVSYCLILSTIADYFAIKLEYLWPMLQSRFRALITNELEQLTDRKLTQLTVAELLLSADGLTTPKL